MWEQYKKTLWAMQVLIGAVTCAVFVWSHLFGLAALFFVTMQLAAVVGTMWGVRLKDKVMRAGSPPAPRG